MSGIFDSDQTVGKALFRWWQSLDDNRADRAELRRCETLLDVMMTPAFQRARRQLIAAGLIQRGGEIDRLPAVVALVAQVTASPNDQHSRPKVAEAFSNGDKPPVSPLRFRQVLEARGGDELFTRLRRVLPLAKDQINLFHLANDVFYWGEPVRKRWVYDYRWPAKETN